MADEAFIASNLYIAAELVRHTLNYTIKAAELAAFIPIGKLELLCMIDVVIKMGAGRSMPKMMIVRLMEMSELVIETDLWKEARIYDFLNFPTKFETNSMHTSLLDV